MLVGHRVQLGVSVLRVETRSSPQKSLGNVARHV